MGTRSRKYRELKDEVKTMGPERLIATLAAEPGLLRRPIVKSGDVVLVGFNEEEYERVFGKS